MEWQRRGNRKQRKKQRNTNHLGSFTHARTKGHRGPSSSTFFSRPPEGSIILHCRHQPTRGCQLASDAHSKGDSSRRPPSHFYFQLDEPIYTKMNLLSTLVFFLAIVGLSTSHSPAATETLPHKPRHMCTTIGVDPGATTDNSSFCTSNADCADCVSLP